MTKTTTHEEAVAGAATPRVGSVLRRAREYWQLSLREVERRTGRSNAYLSQVERGLIRQPDPVVLLELADLYRLDFMQLAIWAGWASKEIESRHHAKRTASATVLVRRVLELDETLQAQVLAFVGQLLRAQRT